LNFFSVLVAMLAKNYGPRECVGVDLSSPQVTYARSRFADVAENLQYVTVSFRDAVIKNLG
jgi:cyclopropane fatty-acyl-phospholipid synthase-like methyltransferase